MDLTIKLWYVQERISINTELYDQDTLYDLFSVLRWSLCEMEFLDSILSTDQDILNFLSSKEQEQEVTGRRERIHSQRERLQEHRISKTQLSFQALCATAKTEPPRKRPQTQARRAAPPSCLHTSWKSLDKLTRVTRSMPASRTLLSMTP